jgi:4-amino-4-deoxy-L-arabinose transferase-like glycosyltransferase
VRLFLAIALAAAWFGTLGIRPLYKADESRYAEISREMVASGDWITPRLNGFKYFEKPPLQYWTTAFFFKVLGEKDWVSRLWTALTGFAGILLVIRAGNRLFAPPAGWFAAAVLAGSPLYVLLGQLNTLDMGLTFFLTAAMLALAGGRMLVFWAACAAAVLSKGLIGIVLPLGAMALYVLVKRDWQLLSKLQILRGGALFLAITAPWFVAVSLANPEFARFFFIHEHFERFTTQVHQRYGPPWYFLPILAAGMAPWLLPVLAGWWRSLSSGAAPARISRAAPARIDAQLLLALWALVVLVFFSLSGSKLASYILPMLPALALLAGNYLTVEKNRLMVAQAALVAASGVAGAILIPRLAGPAYAAYSGWLVAGAVAIAVLACAALALEWQKRSGLAAAALALGGFAFAQLVAIGHGATLGPGFSAAGLIASLEPKPAATAPVFAVDIYDHSLPWYLRRTVTMVAYRDELGQAVDWEPQKFVPDLAAFERAWSAAPAAYAFVAAGDFERLRQRLPMQAVARDPRYVFVRKP